MPHSSKNLGLVLILCFHKEVVVLFTILSAALVCHEWVIRITERTPVKGISKSDFNMMLLMSNLTKFDGKVHSIILLQHNHLNIDLKLQGHK